MGIAPVGGTLPERAIETGSEAEVAHLQYPTPDCSGPAYMDADKVRPLMARFHPTSGLWFTVNSEVTHESLLIQSTDGNSGAEPCQFGVNTRAVTPVVFLEPGLLDYLGELVPPLYAAPAPDPEI